MYVEEGQEAAAPGRGVGGRLIPLSTRVGTLFRRHHDDDEDDDGVEARVEEI